MNQQFFISQINRLKDVYGDKNYPDARVYLIMREVSSISEKAFEQIIDQCIADCRFPPMLADMREKISIAMERQRDLDKCDERNQFHRIRKERYTLEGHDQRMICNTILRRITTGMPDIEWNAFLKLLDQLCEGGAA